MAGHQHRASTSLKQQNKKHKSVRGRTKGMLRRQAGSGRVGGASASSSSGAKKHISSTSSKHGVSSSSKAARLNRAKQLRQLAREAAVSKRRQFESGPAKVVAVVTLSERVDAASVALRLAGGGGMEDDEGGGARVVATTGDVRFVVAAHGDVRGTLDAVAVADAIALCMAYPPEINEAPDDDDGDDRMSTASVTSSSLRYQSLEDACSPEALRVVDAVKALGMPPLAGVLVGQANDDAKPRRKRRLDAAAERMARRYFGGEFGEKVAWQRLDTSPDEVLRLVRCVLAKKREPSWRASRSTVLADDARVVDGLLCVRGWVRVAPLPSSRLVHVPELGAAQIARLDVSESPGTSTPIASFEPGAADEPLEMLAEPDPLAGEQTWPNDAEMVDTAKPTLTSEYQAAWDVDDDDDEDDDDEGVELDRDLNERDAAVQAAAADKRVRLAEEMEFPDEVDTPADVAARERFARYRPIASLRDADWDPYESLPRDYARAHALPNYEASRKAALRFEDTHSAPVGTYVSLYLRGDASRLDAAAREISSRRGSAACVSLLRHENRLSVVHFLVRRVAGDDEPLASKEPVLARVGHRRWLARPVYSHNPLSGRKHKYERFLREGDHCVASFFGPITFSPAPLFLFRRDKLVAVGTAIDADPNRVVLKRVLLTGVPIRTHKRKAVVKHMFHDPDDVRFYKPAQLTTKHGLTANITEPVGTHGLFKISLSRPMKQTDTIMLALYKRVFPKFPVPDDGSSSEQNKGGDGDPEDFSAHFRVY
ncbi:hypothetical protein CTAYLR_000295 [Chrysophaeum taylorii]|uniref:Ribosome biogenesis protein BMS1/TSR1 C-terminal domain-containing protein n=1 Tax=Chrysophaeum taylorii TaxID=2483200 RepID=A0AAD7XL50_9STRA|nr:hypothetical protein CTAYLR_000295 [Chrysophaeum taylorii]